MSNFFTSIKICCVFALFVFANPVKSAHLVGGTLSYEYIGDSTSIPYHYRIKLTLMRTTRYTTLNIGNSYQVCVRSSCIPNQTVTVTQTTPITGNVMTSEFECVESMDSSYTTLFEHVYTGDVTLGGTCSDFIFSHAMVCCRIGVTHISNYTNNGQGGSTNYLEATLNNSVEGENSSPSISAMRGPFHFCTNRDINVYHTAFDKDGDSIQYHLKTALNGPCSGPGEPMIFDPDYTEKQPFPANSNGVHVSHNGIIQFQSTGVSGNFQYVMILKDFRWISRLNTYVQVGSSYVESLLVIAGNCSNSGMMNGPKLDHDEHPTEFYPIDIISRMNNPNEVPNSDTVLVPGGGFGFAFATVEYECLSTEIDLYFNQPIHCWSVATNGTEFRLLSPDTVLVPIISVDPHCDGPGFTQHITLELQTSLPQNGDFLGTVRTGFDGNTLVNPCGIETSTYYTFVLQSIDCPIISTKNFETSKISIFPNPNGGTFTISLTDEPHVVRIYNMVGHCVFEQNISGETTIDNGKLASGNYIILAENQLTGQVERKKLTIVDDGKM
ncbi:MAG: T9SS type A sorting domain-containing protein [Cryomorphaceae bacterium]|nr:T9SS type A sorting domain-containing protein [Cryomorphaceae bacterium]